MWRDIQNSYRYWIQNNRNIGNRQADAEVQGYVSYKFFFLAFVLCIDQLTYSLYGLFEHLSIAMKFLLGSEGSDTF